VAAAEGRGSGGRGDGGSSRGGGSRGRGEAEAAEAAAARAASPGAEQQVHGAAEQVSPPHVSPPSGGAAADAAGETPFTSLPGDCPRVAPGASKEATMRRDVPAGFALLLEHRGHQLSLTPRRVRRHQQRA